MTRKLKEYLSKQTNVKSLHLEPLQHSERIFGALYLENDNLEYAFSSYTNLIDKITTQMAIIIEYFLIVSNFDSVVAREQENNEKLEKINEMKDSFVKAISNELRIPLSSVLSWTEQLKNELVSHEQRQICEMIHSSSQGLLIIINDILDFQACQKNQLTLQKSNFDLRIALDECAQIIRKNVEVSLHISVDHFINNELIINTDKTRLKQVLSNLLSNAMKFTETGNVILSAKVKISDDSSNEILNGRSVDKDKMDDNNGSKIIFPMNFNPTEFITIEFFVKDSGIGIPMDRLPSIFLAFSQLDGSCSRKHSGTGLGLALSQHIIQCLSDHKSNIHCESKLGVGSIFSFQLQLPLVAMNPIRLSTDKIDQKENYKFYIISQNRVLQHIVNQEITFCGFSNSFFIPRTDVLKIDTLTDNDIIILDITKQENMPFFSKFTNIFRFILVGNVNKVGVPNLNSTSAIIFCPLTRKTLANAITKVLNGNVK